MKTVLSPVIVLAVAIFAALGLAASIAFGQETRAESEQQPPQASEADAAAEESVESRAYGNPTELNGAEVVDNEDNTLGEVEDVVVSRRDGEFYLVISSDEFLGLGGQDMTVAVNDLEGSGDRLVVRSQEALQPYLKDQYLRLEEP